MFCNKCGTQLNDNAKFCVVCGSTLEQQTTIPSSSFNASPVQTTYSNKAEMSPAKLMERHDENLQVLIFGILSLFFQSSTLGIIFSIISLVNASKCKNRYGKLTKTGSTGKGLAIYSLVVSILVSVLSIILSIVLVTPMMDLIEGIMEELF